MLPMHEPRPLLEKVAERLAKGKPPEWLADYVERFARLIGYPVVPPEDPDLPRALAAIDLLDNEIKIYATIEEEFGLEVPDSVDAASTALTSLREFFEEQLQLRPTRKGWPRPDSRRQLCALVCASAWRRLYGEMQPHSRWLQEACEDYWQACGHPETSINGNIKNWERFLVEAAAKLAATR